MNQLPARPWYLEPWPWILMAGPAAVVVAGVATVYLAISSDDGLVVDDYYRQGLAINRRLGQDERAAKLGLTATLHFTPSRDNVTVVIRGREIRADALKLRIVHGTRPGQDQIVTLVGTRDGRYAGRLRPISGSGWRTILEDERDGWRLNGRWSVEADLVELSPAQ